MSERDRLQAEVSANSGQRVHRDINTDAGRNNSWEISAGAGREVGTAGRNNRRDKMRRSREMRYKEIRGRRKREMRRKALLGAVGFLALVYIGIGVYFRFHFYEGTIVYGADCSNLNAAKAKKAVAEKLKDYRLEIIGRGVDTEAITAQQINLAYRDDGGIDKMLKKQYAFLWPVMMLMEKNDSYAASFTYDAGQAKAALAALSCMDRTQVQAPVDAYLRADDRGYIVTEEVQGNLLDEGKAFTAVCAALDAGKSAVSLEEADCYQKPSVYQDDEVLNREADARNQFTGAHIIWDFGDRQEIVDTEKIGTWLVKQADGSYMLDEGMVADYVTDLAHTYDTFGLGREFVTSLGYTVSLFGGDYGWLMDQEATTSALLEALKTKYAGTMEPVYIYSAMSRDADDIGGTYVEVCISQQRMWCYENGYLMVDTPVVTGNPNTGHGTPAGGVWAIDSKMRDYTLRGEDYAAPVDYWMAFNGDVGIHDLVSRTAFGGDIYLYGGSHGCVNTPYDQVQLVYSIVSVGTPVIVYE